jgi:hypothetical protein
MKLSTAWVDQTQSQFDVEALPENHPAAGKLNETFGEHTFFVGAEGLHIVEEIESLKAGSGALEVVKLASWRDDKRDTLEIHDPEPVGVVVAADGIGGRRN